MDFLFLITPIVIEKIESLRIHLHLTRFGNILKRAVNSYSHHDGLVLDEPAAALAVSKQVQYPAPYPFPLASVFPYAPAILRNFLLKPKNISVNLDSLISLCSLS